MLMEFGYGSSLREVTLEKRDSTLCNLICKPARPGGDLRLCRPSWNLAKSTCLKGAYDDVRNSVHKYPKVNPWGQLQEAKTSS